MTLEERITLQSKEMNKKVLEDFLSQDWLHPVFQPRKRQVFRRITGPIAFNLEDDEEIMTETLRDNLPGSSIIGGINTFLTQKARKQAQQKVNLSQQKPLELEKVLELNQTEYTRFISVERYEKKEEQANATNEQNVIGALTDFNLVKKQEEAAAAKKAAEDAAEKAEATAAELEKRKVDEYRQKRKDELETLYNELAQLNGIVCLTNFRTISSDEERGC